MLCCVILYPRRNQRDSELDEIRATLLEIEKQSDDKLTIGNTQSEALRSP